MYNFELKGISSSSEEYARDTREDKTLENLSLTLGAKAFFTVFS